jgi:hypothetical protein
MLDQQIADQARQQRRHPDADQHQPLPGHTGAVGQQIDR